MKRIWESIAGLILTAVAIFMIYQLIRPYALLIVIVMLVTIIGERFYRHARRG